jgi:hypothetical protein
MRVTSTVPGSFAMAGVPISCGRPPGPTSTKRPTRRSSKYDTAWGLLQHTRAAVADVPDLAPRTLRLEDRAREPIAPTECGFRDGGLPDDDLGTPARPSAEEGPT